MQRATAPPFSNHREDLRSVGSDNVEQIADAWAFLENDGLPARPGPVTIALSPLKPTLDLKAQAGHPGRRRSTQPQQLIVPCERRAPFLRFSSVILIVWSRARCSA